MASRRNIAGYRGVAWPHGRGAWAARVVDGGEVATRYGLQTNNRGKTMIRFQKPTGRLGFVAFPAVVDFAEDAQLGSGLVLGLTGQETAIPQSCPQKSGFLVEAFAL